MWWQTPQPDLDTFYWENSIGEFSELGEAIFIYHLSKLENQKQNYQNDKIFAEEKLWYW